MSLPVASPSPDPALQGLTVLQRGWLSSNNIVLHGQGEGAVLVDSGHVTHRDQTLALVRHALGGEALSAIVNTHLHSDHCGGNFTLQRALGGHVHVPPGSWAAATAWDEGALSYRPTGQRCERFQPDAMLVPGQTLGVGSRRWQVLAAPGHDPDSIMLADLTHGVLISADALWQNGFGVVFPELEGEPGFDEVEQVLDLIAGLDLRWVIPGHGAPFQDVAAALQRARSRLAQFRNDPRRHAAHAFKVLLKYHLMEERRQALAECLAWFAATPLCEAIWQRLDCPQGSLQAYGERVLQELVTSGALALHEGVVMDA